MNSMDINSKPGTKVVYAHPKNGLPAHAAHARKHLTEGATYTVKNVVVGPWCTSVEFGEHPNLWFNSVLFAPAEPDANCYTVGNGDCVSEKPCMHSA